MNVDTQKLQRIWDTTYISDGNVIGAARWHLINNLLVLVNSKCKHNTNMKMATFLQVFYSLRKRLHIHIFFPLCQICTERIVYQIYHLTGYLTFNIFKFKRCQKDQELVQDDSHSPAHLHKKFR